MKSLRMVRKEFKTKKCHHSNSNVTFPAMNINVINTRFSILQKYLDGVKKAR